MQYKYQINSATQVCSILAERSRSDTTRETWTGRPARRALVRAERRLCGEQIRGDICVLFTANDAYMRDLEIVVPSDCVASATAKANRAALALMKKVLKADTRSSDLLDLEELAGSDDKKAE